MNNNRGNNRRRSRGNNNRQQNGGAQLNRIDSRARGNAPQLLEKYRKLAQDAHLNGDRVQAEYYLQFADHYFRVLADTRLRQEEARARRDDRWQDAPDAGGEGEDAGDFMVESDFPTFDTPPVYTRREREERDSGPNGQQNGNPPRRREEPRDDVRDEPRDDAGDNGEAGDAEAEVNPYEPPANPFLRENRNKARGLRPRREDGRRDDARGSEPRGDRRPRREDRAERGPRFEAAEGSGLEAALPPSISAPRKVAEEAVSAPAAAPVETPAAEAAPAPKRRAPRKKPAGDAGETLENA